MKTPANNQSVFEESFHAISPKLCSGGVLERVNGQLMLRMADRLSYDQTQNKFRVLKEWRPGHYSKDLYQTK